MKESDYTDYHCRNCGETNLVYTGELAALKAENERLNGYLDLFKQHNEHLKEDLQKMHDGYDDAIEKVRNEVIDAIVEILKGHRGYWANSPSLIKELESLKV